MIRSSRVYFLFYRKVLQLRCLLKYRLYFSFKELFETLWTWHGWTQALVLGQPVHKVQTETAIVGAKLDQSDKASVHITISLSSSCSFSLSAVTLSLRLMALNERTPSCGLNGNFFTNNVTQTNGEAHSNCICEEPQPCVPPWVVLDPLFHVFQLETCPVCPSCQTDNELFTKHSFGAWGQQSTESPCAMGRCPSSAITLNIYLGGLDQLQWPSSKSKWKCFLCWTLNCRIWIRVKSLFLLNIGLQ